MSKDVERSRKMSREAEASASNQHTAGERSTLHPALRRQRQQLRRPQPLRPLRRRPGLVLPHRGPPPMIPMWGKGKTREKPSCCRTVLGKYGGHEYGNIGKIWENPSKYSNTSLLLGAPRHQWERLPLPQKGYSSHRSFAGNCVCTSCTRLQPAPLLRL